MRGPNTQQSFQIAISSNLLFDLIKKRNSQIIKMALIVGHSHVKYFQDYLFDDKIDSLSYSGSKIEELWEKIEDGVHKYKVRQ